MIYRGNAFRSGFVFWATTLLIVLLCRPVLAGNTLYQYSTIDALLGSLFDGNLTIRELKYKGDFGLGTVNGLDGELVVLDGEAYHIRAGGEAAVPPAEVMVPFASVTFFNEELTLALGEITSLDELNAAILKEVPSLNLFYGIRIDGEFSKVKARAIPKQKPPYASLASLVKQQVVVELSGPGTLVGFYSPIFVKGVNVPGFHWHFLTADRLQGGHVLDCSLAPSSAQLDILREFSMQLPVSKAFDELDLSGDKSGELHRVEKDPAKKK